MGAASAGAGMMRSYAGHQRDQEMTRLGNARLRAQYRYDQQATAEYNRQADQINAYKENVYQQDLKNISQAYELGTFKNALNYREQQDEAAFASFQMAQQAAGAGGQLLAKGISGRSARLMDNQVGRLVGQNEAMIRNNLMRARFATTLANDDLRNRAIGMQNQARGRRGLNIAHRSGPLKPIYAKGPSSLGLFANLGADALGGLSSGMNFQGNIQNVRSGGNPDFMRF